MVSFQNRRASGAQISKSIEGPPLVSQDGLQESVCGKFSLRKIRGENGKHDDWKKFYEIWGNTAVSRSTSRE